MAQIIIYSLRQNLAGRKKAISDALHACVTASLGLPADKRFHRFIALEEEDFLHPSDRSPRYTIIEISMFEGRTKETKKELIRLIFRRFEEELGIPPQDVEITIHESPKENWGIRGKPGDELTLSYKVEK
ncbi:MAG TPA: tautomerase family protein [Verrucomicrobiae bacterium]|jgi:4-oxalocrotonate tautomerase family enzyme|nr:tautomerase family protein [Verrucomicrobiae bacterium]